MTLMMAEIAALDEAEAAVGAGADILAVPAGMPEAELRALAALAAGRCRTAVTAALPAAAEAAWASGIDLAFAVGGWAGPGHGISYGMLFADAAPDLALLAGLARDGYAGALMTVSAAAAGRLLRHADLPALHGFVQGCRRHGLAAGLSGALEPPDVPRLLLLRPDLLGVRGRPARLRQVRALLDAPAPEPAGSATDRIFVHDLELPVRIGAYAHERAAAQRMRFAVDAWVTRPVEPVRDLSDVVSYDIISDTIRLLAATEHVDLVETLAERIAAALLAHARVVKIRLTLEKLDTGSGRVGVIIERSR